MGYVRVREQEPPRARPEADSHLDLAKALQRLVARQLELTGSAKAVYDRRVAVNLESADDRASVRIAVQSDDALEGLRALKAAEGQVENWLQETVALARTKGESWSAISDALGVSRQAAWKLYNVALAAALEETRSNSGLSEEEASDLARTELKGARRSRRRT